MSLRIEKINSLIQKYISEILSRELSLKPGVFLTVSKVDTTKDLRYTNVFISIFPEKEANYAVKTLEKEKYRIQKILSSKLQMKILPQIVFKSDNTAAQADEIEKILRRI